MATMSEINKETDRVFDEMFSIEDIMKGNTIEMRAEARKIAIANLAPKNAIISEELVEHVALLEAKAAGGDKYSKIFNTEAPDVDFLDIIKQSMKDKPFIVQVPKNMDRKLFDKFSQMTHDMALKALEDEDCNAVHIAYVKV